MNKYVMDASVILNDFSFRFSDDEQYFTTNDVLDELIDFRSKHLVEVGLKQEKIVVREPSKDFFTKAERAANALRIRERLSRADISIVALAFQLNLPLLSDDVQVQKLCLQLRIPFDSVFRQKIQAKVAVQ